MDDLLQIELFCYWQLLPWEVVFHSYRQLGSR